MNFRENVVNRARPFKKITTKKLKREICCKNKLAGTIITMEKEIYIMDERLLSIKQEILDGIEKNATSRATAFELRKQFLDSKTGKIGQLMKEMKNIFL